MPTRILTAILLLIGLAAIAVPSVVVMRFDRATEVRTVLHTRLQSLAEKSCKCARNANGKAGKAECWHPFDVAVAPERDPHAGDSYTACEPLSTQSVSLADGSMIVRSYDIIVGDGEGAFCTQAEAMAAEKSFAEEPEVKTPEGTFDSFDSLFALSRAYARGERVTEGSFPGCAGGIEP